MTSECQGLVRAAPAPPRPAPGCSDRRPAGLKGEPFGVTFAFLPGRRGGVGIRLLAANGGKGFRGVSGSEEGALVRRALPHHVRHVDPGAVGIVAMLGIATLQQENAGAAEGTVAYTLAAIKDWTFLLGPGWVVGWGNGLILGYMMYRTQLVPRPWTWLGLVGGPLIIISGTVVMFGGNPASATIKGPASIPEALWELFLGVYCTIWGFTRDAPILSGSAS